MNHRRITGLLGAAGALAVGTEIAHAQDDLGASIAEAVTSAVSSIDTDGSSASGGVSIESTQTNFGEETGTAIADASGGNNNVVFAS
jgi:hypothetical protein